MGDTNQAPDEATSMGKRFPIKLPIWHEKRLVWWAAMKGTSKTAQAQNVLQTRVEANEEHIESMLADRAKDLGIPVDDLKAMLLKKAGVDPSVDDDLGDDDSD